MNMILATVCVVLFSMTVPATRIAAQALPPELVATFRLLGAGLLCILIKLALDRWVPPRRIWLPLLATSIGSVWGFSLLTAFAMKSVPGTHGAIALAALPSLTASYASLRDRTNPGFRFWAYCALGSLATSGFFLSGSQGSLRAGDLMLGLAACLGAFGYVEGGRLSREFGGTRVMSWAILIAMPFALALLLLTRSQLPKIPTAASVWIALAYLAIVSQSLGMFLWYQVLARGPMAKIALIQLLQPFLTLIGAVVLLGETTSPATWLTAAVVAASIFGANRERKAKPQVSSDLAGKPGLSPLIG